MSSIFSKIVRREIPAHIVAENNEFLAFLDINPLVEGHVLVIPKIETDYIFDITDDELAQFMIFAKQVAVKIKYAIPCRRIGVTVIGLEVAHAHIHLLPMNSVEEMNFSKEKLKLTNEELSVIAERIRNAN